MSVLEWKKFNLYNLVPYVESNRLRAIKADITAQCHNTSQKIWIFCDELGWVHVFRSWGECISFQAHSGAIHLCAIANSRESNLLVTLATQQPDGLVTAAGSSIQLNVFNLQKITKRHGAPSIAYARLTCNSSATVLRAHLLHDGQLCIAIGCDRGELQLHRAPLGRGDMSASFRNFTVSLETITGIEFREWHIEKNSACNLFICSHAGVFCYTLMESNDIGETKIVLDTKKEPTHCCTIYTMPDGATESYFIVGRDDALYCFTNDGRGPCYALDGRKRSITSFGNNLVVVMGTPPTLVIIDIYNKMIVLQRKIDDLANVLCVENVSSSTKNHSCFILTKSRELFVLRERDLQRKLRLLVGKNLYDIALRLLEDDASIHSSKVGQIYLQYGDHLMLKGDINAAVDKYIKTIGTVEPYCVIRKLLESRYNCQLAQYLKALKQTKHATSEHLELLRNCYDRLALPKRIKSDDICLNENSAAKNKSFRYVPAVKETRLLDFLQLLHDNDSERILNFFALLGGEEQIYDFFAEHGQMLMRHYPFETTDTLKLIYDAQQSAVTSPLIHSPEHLMPLLLASNDCSVNFIEHITFDHIPSNLFRDSHCVQSVYNFLFEVHLRKWRRGSKPTAELLKFLRSHASKMCESHIYILCRTYAFWAGIVHMYEQSAQHHLSMRYFVNSGNFSKAFACSVNSANLSLPNLWIQALNKRKSTYTHANDDLISKHSVHLINKLLNATLQGEGYSFLQLLQGISDDKNLCVMHIKDFFAQAHLQQTVGSSLRHQIEVFQKLHDDMQSLNRLLGNFYSNPIEFRSSICDICRRQLKLPAIYFLCQHSYHKECISDYATNDEYCVACVSQKKNITSSEQQQLSACPEIQYSKFTTSSNDIIEAIASFLGHDIFNQFTDTSRSVYLTSLNKRASITENIKLQVSNSKHWSGRLISESDYLSKKSYSMKQYQPAAVSKNPPEDYDANLNPFSEDLNPFYNE